MKIFAEPSIKVPSVALWAALILLAVLNLLLLRQNLQMRSQMEKIQPKVLRPEDKVQSFSASGLRGEPININYTGEETRRILLYFTPACPYCQEQFLYWKEILSRVNRNKYQVLGIVSESEDRIKVSEYLRSVGCESMRVAFVAGSVLSSYKLSMTPTTVVIDNNGNVEKTWVGKWDSGIAAEASSVLGLSFESD